MFDFTGKHLTTPERHFNSAEYKEKHRRQKIDMKTNHFTLGCPTNIHSFQLLSIVHLKFSSFMTHDH